MAKKKQAELLPSNPYKAAIAGFLFSVPYVLVNFIVAIKIDPFYSFIAMNPFLRESSFLPLVLLTLFPVGAFVAIRPLLKSGVKAKNKTFNISIAMLMFAVFLLLAYAVGGEYLDCKVLYIPKCA